ncbi:MAG: DUF5678 domain-containing protein [Elusimicrobiota bacterium]
MGQKIWGMLTDYEGRWVAVDKGGQVVAHAETLPDVVRAVGGREHRVTFLYAAAERAEAEV